MRVVNKIALGVLVAASSGLGLNASGSDLSKFLRAVFDEHHDRPPSGAEMNYYANLSRTEGPLEAYIRMVSSNDYYVTQCQQNVETYVTRLHQLFLHRNPRPDELRFWVNQFLQTGSRDRSMFVRQFCQASNVQQVPSAPLPYQAAFRPPNTRSAAADTLVTKVELLQNLVQREIGGSRFGRSVLDPVATLLSASVQFRDTTNSPQSTEQQLRIATDNVERALQQVETQFRTVPAVSSQVQNLLWEISQLVTAVNLNRGFASSRAAPPNPVLVSADQLSMLIRQYLSLLSNFQNRNPAYASLYRDMNGLFVQNEGLRRLARTSTRSSDLQRVVNSMLTQSRNIAAQVRQADISLQQGWWNIQHEMDRLSSSAGCGGDLYVTSNHPVVLSRPAWNGFPGQLSPGFQASATNRQVVDLADQLLSAIDNYVNSLRPIASRNREVSRMIDQTLDLRHDVLVVRQKAAAGAFGTQLRYASRDVTRQYSDVASQTFAKMVGQDPTLNSPVWVQIGQLAYQIDKTIGT